MEGEESGERSLIPYDAMYYKPRTIKEAIDLFYTLDKEGKNPIYFSGGTEILTLGRTGRLVTGAMIDIKSIEACLEMKNASNEIRLGAALSLTRVIETNLFPLLSETAAQIADQTARNKITLGGNICGNIPYNEAVLPFLITNSKAIIASKNGLKEYSFKDLFNKKLQLSKGEFLVQVQVERVELELPYTSIKKRKQWGVGYPLITATAIKKDDQLKVAFSGLCDFPFHNPTIDTCINNADYTEKERWEAVLKAIPAPILDDVHGSSEYRAFVLGNLLEEVIDALEGVDS